MDGYFKIYAINEKLVDVKTTLFFEVMNFTGETVALYKIDLLVIPANSRRTESFDLLLPSDLNPNLTYFRTRLYDYSTKALLHTDNFFYVRPIARVLPKPNVQVTCNDALRSCSFSTTNFAHYLYLELKDSNDTTLRLSQNFFDLTPGLPPLEVKILSNHTLAEISSQLVFKTLYDTYN